MERGVRCHTGKGHRPAGTGDARPYRIKKAGTRIGSRRIIPLCILPGIDRWTGGGAYPPHSQSPVRNRFLALPRCMLCPMRSILLTGMVAN